MQNFIKKSIFFGIFIFAFGLLGAQNITVTSLRGTPVDTILQRYLQGDGVLISGHPAPNVFNNTEHGRFNGQYGNANTEQIGTFDRNGASFPFSKGLILTTGNVSVAPGPNNTTSGSGPTSPTYIENDLLPYATNTIVNSASLEFDFIAVADGFSLNYILASEEYPEFACTNYNDVFAFLLTGIDPVTLQTSTTNVAVVPNSVSAAYPNGVPVGVNSINPGPYNPDNVNQCIPPGNPFTQYYVNNPPGSPGIQYDGRTVALTAGAPISSCQKYHMKLAIANLGDNAYDSGLFFEQNSFSSHGVKLDCLWENEPGGDTLVQGSNEQVSMVFRSGYKQLTNNTSIIIMPLVGNTAVMGTDYSLVTQTGDIINLNNPSFFIPSGDSLQEVRVMMLPTIGFDNPNQVKVARLHVVTQGCSGFGDLMNTFRKDDTIVLYFCSDSFGPDNSGIADRNVDSRWVVYPNPAGEIVTVNLKDLSDEVHELELLDMSGRVLKVVKTNGNSTKVPLSGLPGGVYAIRIHPKEGPMVRFFVRQ